LEMRVKERTAELGKIVNALQEEVFQRIKTEEDLKESEQRYRSLTVATTQIVWTADAKGRVGDDIPSWRNFTGQSVEAVKGQGWIEALHPDDRKPAMKIWSQAVRNHSFYQTEYRLRRNDGKYRYMAVRGVPVQEEDGSIVEWVGTCDDITERKEMENRRHITNTLLTLFVQKTSRKEYLDSVVEIIGRLSGCRCVGIRLANADGYIPYKAYTGFCEEFLTLESKLSLNEDVCACIRVVTNRPDPQDAVVMTEKGSFRCDNTFNFVDSLSENEKKRFRGNCLHAGFASVAVVPVRYRQNILGAIHLADEQENKVPLETVEFLEEMAAMIGEAVYRFSVEESLRLNEGRLLEAQRLAHLGNWEWNIAKGTLWWSDEVYRIFGLEPQPFGATYEALLSYVHPDDRKLVDESVDRALREGIEYNIEHRVIRPDGNERIVNEKARVIYDARHKPIKMAGTVYDITEQKNAEQELHEKQKQLRALAAQLQIVEEKERRRIARDLHDSIGQILAFSSRELDTIQKSLPDKMAQSLREIINQLDNAIVQTRTLSFDLSPSTLYDFGFEIAVEDLLDRIAKEKNIQCQYENCPGAKPLAEDVKVLLYRSVRELLINAVKHADSSLIKVSIFRSGSVIYVKVEDNGRGFDVSVLESGSRRSGGFGLFSVRERLNQIGGRLKMESAQGKGTKAVLTAPLDLEEGN
ncbi:MAG: PAS domain S-box protein, partial [Candidatus Brocadiia bacterium]